eukprot:1321796-Lingulodinium_polyedra.AAC.1
MQFLPVGDNSFHAQINVVVGWAFAIGRRPPLPWMSSVRSSTTAQVSEDHDMSSANIFGRVGAIHIASASGLSSLVASGLKFARVVIIGSASPFDLSDYA